jgi:hypothetical protein
MVYNFGSSQSLGHGHQQSSKSFPEILSRHLGVDLQQYAESGTGLEYSIYKLLTVFDNIQSDDIVLFQINCNPNYVMRAKENGEILNIWGVSQILKFDDEYGQSLQDAYANDVFNAKDFTLHYVILISLLTAKIKLLPCKSFVYLCGPVPEWFKDNVYYELMNTNSLNIIDVNNFTDYVKVRIPEYLAPDGAHIDVEGHALWADYIKEKLDL